jgi:hypothetical protein
MYEKLLSIFGGNLLEGVKDLIQTFKLPPEQALQAEMKVKELEHDIKTKAMVLDVEDRKSAREREMAVKGHTVSILAYVIIGSFVAVCFFMIGHSYVFPDIKMQPEQIGMVGTIIGYLAAKAEQVTSYFFGSSASSEKKTDAMVKSMSGK